MKYMLATLSLVALLAAAATADTTRVMPGGVFGTWTERNSPYVIEGDVMVPSGQALKIGPRVTVYFAGHYTFTVSGQLQAEAREKKRLKLRRNDEDVIRFTTDLAQNPAGWGGLRFINAEDDCKLENCIIEYGRASGSETRGMGGAIYCENSALSIANCVVRSNTSAGPGGALAAVQSELAVGNCSISGNTAGNDGGAIFVSGGELALANVSLSENDGGGIVADNGAELALANCSISDNRGRGLAATNTEVSVANCAISGNERGGMSLLSRSELAMANCSVHRNRGGSEGGGIYCAASSASLVNCSVNDNSPGGIHCIEGCEVELTNCSVRNNEGGPALYRDATSHITRVNVSADE